MGLLSRPSNVKYYKNTIKKSSTISIKIIVGQLRLADIYMYTWTNIRTCMYDIPCSFISRCCDLKLKCCLRTIDFRKDTNTSNTNLYLTAKRFVTLPNQDGISAVRKARVINHRWRTEPGTGLGCCWVRTACFGGLKLTTESFRSSLKAETIWLDRRGDLS